MDTRIYEPASGGKTTVFYFEIADGMDINHGFSLAIVPESEPEIYSDEELTKPVEKEEFMDAYRSGTVVVSCFTSSVALGNIQRYFVVGGIIEGKDEGAENNVRVDVSPLTIPDPVTPSAKTYYISTDTEWNTSGRPYIHKTPEILSTNRLSDSELETLANSNPYTVWLADIDSKDASGKMRKYSIVDTKYLDEPVTFGARWVFYVNAAVASESGEGRMMKYFG